MKHQKLVVIDCGEDTCAGESGMCRFVRTHHFGTRWSCLFYEVDLRSDVVDGWLQRSEQCKREFKRPRGEINARVQSAGHKVSE